MAEIRGSGYNESIVAESYLLRYYSVPFVCKPCVTIPHGTANLFHELESPCMMEKTMSSILSGQRSVS